MSSVLDTVVDLLSLVFLLLGSVVVFTTGVGLHRLHRFFTRLHAASITDTLGAGAILFGLALQSGFERPMVTLKLWLILVFLVLTGPVATHALAKAARLQGVRPQGPDEAPRDQGGTR